MLQTNKKVSGTPAPKLSVSDKVWLSSRNIKTARLSKKLDFRRLGPFAINYVINSHAYRWTLPPSKKIHLVFHVSRLEPANEDQGERQVIPPLLPVKIEGHKELEVKEVLDCPLSHRGPQCVVKWSGYKSATWQPAQDLLNAPADVERFHRLPPTQPGPS